MRLDGPSGQLDLEVVGYQFGEARGDRFDDSWLVIEGSVR